MRISKIAKRMMLVVCLLLPAITAAAFLYYRSWYALPFALGAALGVFLNVFKIITLDRMVTKVVTMETARARSYAKIQQLLRFLFTIAILLLSAFLPFINLIGTAAGVLTYQVAVFFIKGLTEQDDMPDAKEDS